MATKKSTGHPPAPQQGEQDNSAGIGEKDQFVASLRDLASDLRARLDGASALALRESRWTDKREDPLCRLIDGASADFECELMPLIERCCEELAKGVPAAVAGVNQADPDVRHRLALEASWAIEATAIALGEHQQQVRNGLEEPYMFLLAASGMLRRIKELSSVIMSVLGGDDNRETSKMWEIVYDEPMPQAEVSHD